MCSARSDGTSSPTRPMSAMPRGRQPITRELNGRPYGYTLSAVQPRSDERERTARRSRCRTICCGPTAATRRSSQREFTGYADYHSLQVSLNRRRSADGLTFGDRLHLPDRQQDARRDRSVPGRQPRAQLQLRRPPAAHVHGPLFVLGAEPRAHRASGLAGMADDWQISGVTTRCSAARRAASATPTRRADRHAQRQRLDRRRPEPAADRLRSDAAALPANIRASVQDRVHRRAGRSVQLRDRARRRVPRAGLRQLGHLRVQDVPDRRQPAPAAARRALQRLRQAYRGRPSTRTRSSTTRRAR